MTYWRLHYHLIWATFERQPLLTPENEKLFYGVLYGKADELGLKVHAAGNVEDHVHVVVSLSGPLPARVNPMYAPAPTPAGGPPSPRQKSSRPAPCARRSRSRGSRC